jgi:hypothetical protein
MFIFLLQSKNKCRVIAKYLIKNNKGHWEKKSRFNLFFIGIHAWLFILKLKFFQSNKKLNFSIQMVYQIIYD